MYTWDKDGVKKKKKKDYSINSEDHEETTFSGEYDVAVWLLK